jgi:uncharacterized YccA/Bax inhibitor family protein
MLNPSNPVFNESQWAEIRAMSTDRMTLEGTAVKSLLLIGIIVATGFYAGITTLNNPASGMFLMIVGLIGGLVSALVLIFGSNERAPILAPIYAAFEGLFLGPITILYESMYDGIAMNAVSLTLGIAVVMGLLHSTRIIKITEGFKKALGAAIAGIFLVYMVNLVMMMFGASISILHSASPLGIGLSVVIIAIASFSLLMDYDFIEKGVRSGAPKHMEWYAAFGLVVTLVWLYLELLRLLSKLQRR